MSVPFRRLALGGGGVKGILHIGALQELAKYQPLVFPDGIYGTSVGSIIAAYIAFGLPIENALEIVKKYLNFEKVVPKPSFIYMAKALSTKGMFSMDLFEQNLIEMFQEMGVDIKTKKISDANMPLYIVSSNITKGKPTIFSNHVSVVDAIKCSCCIPGVFKPQELYGSLYVDGDVFSPSMTRLLPNNENTLILSLPKTTYQKLTPESIDKISPIDYIHDLYVMTMIQFYKSHKTHNTLQLQYPNLKSTSNLNEFDVNHILEVSAKSLRTFITQRTDQECSESISTRLS